MTDSSGPTVPAWWPLAHIVRSPPARAPRPWCRSRGMVAPMPPGLPATSPAAAPGCDPKADVRVVGSGAPLRHPGAARLAGRHPGRLADLPFGLAAQHLPATPRCPRHVARAIPARARQAILSRGSRPSRTAQPPRRAPVVGRELPSRKDDRGGTTAGTTGIASGLLTRVKHDPQACNFDNFRQRTPARARTHQSRLFGLSRKSNSPIVRMPSSSM